jgi:hypothetical protein
MESNRKARKEWRDRIMEQNDNLSTGLKCLYSTWTNLDNQDRTSKRIRRGKEEFLWVTIGSMVHRRLMKCIRNDLEELRKQYAARRDYFLENRIFYNHLEEILLQEYYRHGVPLSMLITDNWDFYYSRQDNELAHESDYNLNDFITINEEILDENEDDRESRIKELILDHEELTLEFKKLHSGKIFTDSEESDNDEDLFSTEEFREELREKMLKLGFTEILD